MFKATCVQAPYLSTINPVVKLICVILVTVLVSVTSAPALPLCVVIAVYLLTVICGGVSALSLLRRMLPFFGVSVSFMVFMLLLKGMEQAGSDVRIFVFGYTSEALNTIMALGLRILAISLATLSFVITTNPNELVLSLILQLRVPIVHGYAALAAYRFLPTLQDEAKGIRLAQEIRGVEWNKGLFNRMLSPFRLMLPMLALAARKGERVALAMDSRGLGANRTRTFYRRTMISKRDIVFLVLVIAFCIALVLALVQLGLFVYGSALGAGAI